MPKLIHVDGDRVVRQIDLVRARYTCGRDAECDLVFDESKVSRHHATLLEEYGSYTLVDEGSSNHVYVNGEQINRRQLRSGDVLGLSRKVSLIYLAERPADRRIERMLGRVWQAVREEDFLGLKAVTRRIVAADELPTILEIILAEVIRLVGADRGFIALTDDAGQIQRDAAVTLEIDLDDEGLPVGFSQSVVREVIAERQRVFLLRRRDTDTQPHSTSVVELDLRSVMCAPLLFDGRLVGLLYVDTVARLKDFDEMEQLFFVLLADHAAIAIENTKAALQGRRSVLNLQRRAAESESRYDQLVELSPDGVLVQSRRRVLFANAAARDLLAGRPEAPLEGSDPLGLIHDESKGRLQELSYGSGAPFRLDDMTLLSRAGEAISVDIVGSPLTFHGEEAAMLLVRDMRQHRQLEAERGKTQKLESLGVLAGGIAHDFNNILAGVMGNISVARKVDVAVEVREEALEEAATAADRARDLARQLLTFAKGGRPMKRTLRLAELLTEAASFALRGSNVRCTRDFPGDLWWVDADEGQMAQVIQNIVINADQAMPGGGSLVIRASNRVVDGEHPGLSPGRYVEVLFEDRGPGIAEAHRQHVFDPYFSTKDGGSGLGLAIAYSVVHKHGGALDLQDGSHGACFRLLLPASDEPMVQLGEPPREAPRRDVEGGRILVVDDERLVRNAAARILRTAGFEVECVESGEDALARWQAEDAPTIDLMLMDLTIPGGMGGKETLDALRELGSEVKAIVFSGYSNDPVMAAYQEYGFDGVVTKPFDLETLTRTIEEVLSTPRS